MKLINFLIASLLLININVSCQSDTFVGTEISFPSLDDLEITADLYKTDQESDVYIILYHQANFSRGSYRTIAPKLTNLGYNCVAVDQRSGHKARDIINKTCKRAIKQNKKIKFGNAVQDIDAAFLYVRDELKAKKIIIWGSSYSASVVFHIGAKYTEEVDGILSFSPGEYFEIEDKTIATFAQDVKCPVFITSTTKEEKKWKTIYDNITSEKTFFLPEKGGFHGSKALWKEKEGHEKYWEAVITFLESIE